MQFINQQAQLSSFIKIYKQKIPQDVCQRLISNSENYEWNEHTWQSYNTVVPSEDPDHEFLRASISKWDQLMIHENLNICINWYQDEMFQLGSAFMYNGISHPNINKYITNSKMSPHVDHIHSIFSDTNKGIPFLSLVALLNNDYKGGEFVFWEDYKVDLSAGDILIFPSNFLYKHRVNLVSEGTRYSLVSWIY